jgi:hypothetical protein
MKKNPRVATASTVAMKRAPSCADVIRSALSKMPEIDAVFVLTDDANAMHVFSVVREFQSKIYDKLLKKERAIEKEFPETAFEFHVRAHQGREPAEAVPFDAELVYAR